MTRYARQVSVPGFGEDGQAALAVARILVVGAGGLAAPALQYLVGAGVGFVRLVDPDVVDISNLHRQTLFRTPDIGAAKARAAAAHLQQLNPDTDIEAVVTSLDPGTTGALAHGVDLVLDCADSFAVSYILSDHCNAAGVPLLSGSVIGTGGYVVGTCGAAPSLRAVFPELPQRLGSCAQDGVLGPVVGIIGSLLAQMTMALLTGQGTSPLGRVVSFNGDSLRFGGFDFNGAPEPTDFAPFILPRDIRADDFVADLRSADEAPLIVPTAHRLTVADIGVGGPLPGGGQRAVLVCRTGHRAWTAAETLRATWGGDLALVACGDPQSPDIHDT